MSQRQEYIQNRTPITFLDLFAGAGGISEGFLQADADNKYYDFILASDINANCELTHRVRYNKQLGLDTKFLTEDIMSDTFLPNLRKMLGGKQIDVVTGGPSCQSFSLSGRRRKFDKRDDLFHHYLKVIRFLRPKYFVMENVKGLLTKDGGRFKEEILRQIRSIIDDTNVSELYMYLDRVLSRSVSSFVKNALILKVRMDVADNSANDELKEQFFSLLENQFRQITRKVDYRVSKTNTYINTIRHGLSLLRRDDERNKIRQLIINEKTVSNIDNDVFVNPINEFIESISDESILDRMVEAFDNINEFREFTDETNELKSMLNAYAQTLDETLDDIKQYAKKTKTLEEYEQILKDIRLYQIEQPFVALSANYGVPQNRERVLFIGCRKDQQLISDVPATVKPEERVTVYEAISDLDFIGNGEVKTEYGKVKTNSQYDHLIKNRLVDGSLCAGSPTFAEWSRKGRLSERFDFECKPFYVKTEEDLDNMFADSFELHNHQTSKQAEDVKERLAIIAKHGEYDEACKDELKARGLESNKRNYTVLNPAGQSPTVVTMPDDFIHYSEYRAMTVREMARLQSFDDSFVFQGKRQTGGENRKSEIPQYTLVGNAVPPLMARAIGNTILKAIK